MEISNDLKQIVKDWQQGKALRLLTLGHSQTVRQRLTYDCIFRVIATFKDSTLPETIDEINMLVGETGREMDLSIEECQAAASVVYVALRKGWATALAGHAENKYSMLTREGQST